MVESFPTGSELRGWGVSPANSCLTYTFPLRPLFFLAHGWSYWSVITWILVLQKWPPLQLRGSTHLQLLATFLCSIRRCFSGTQEFTSQIMLGTKDKRTSQTFLIEGLSSTKAPVLSVCNQVFENYLSGARSSSLNYLFYRMKIMKVQNVPTHFIKGDFIYIPCSWIITKPYTHSGHAAYTIYICAGKRWKNLCQTSFLINSSSSPLWVPFFNCGMLKVKDSSELQLTKTLVNAVQLNVIVIMFFWVNKFGVSKNSHLTLHAFIHWILLQWQPFQQGHDYLAPVLLPSLSTWSGQLWFTAARTVPQNKC